jgi:hypothetical protein
MFGRDTCEKYQSPTPINVTVPGYFFNENAIVGCPSQTYSLIFRFKYDEMWMFSNITLTNRLCQSYNDPHITTFDGKLYHYMEVGEFVMYRNDKGPFWVFMFTSFRHLYFLYYFSVS